MAGYVDTRQMIIDTLMGRPAGTEIQPEDHQAFALQITDYVRQVELVAGNATPIGFADASTVPVQPDNGQAVYLSQVNRGTTVMFANFIDQNGNAISVTSDSSSVTFVTLLWNGQYWSSQTTIVSASVLTAETFRVTFTESGGTITSSDSASTIHNAISDGKYVYAVFGDNVIPLVSEHVDTATSVTTVIFQENNNFNTILYSITGGTTVVIKDPIWKTLIKSEYKNTFSEIYVVNKALIGIDSISVWNYDGTLTFWGYSGSTLIWKNKRTGLSTVQNGDIVEVTCETAGGGVSVGDVLAYVVFKDIDSFRGTTYASKGNEINLNYCKNLSFQQKINGFLSLSEDGAVTTAKIADGAVTTAKVPNDEPFFNAYGEKIWANTVKAAFIYPKYTTGQVNGILVLYNSAGKLYVWGYTSGTGEGNPIWRAELNILNYNDGDLITLKCTTAGGAASLNDIIGYVIFKDISTFRASTIVKSVVFFRKEYVTKPYHQLEIFDRLKADKSTTDALSTQLSFINCRTKENTLILTDLSKKVLDEQQSQVALAFTPYQNTLSKLYNSSAFSGFGWYLGPVNTFRYLHTKFYCSDWKPGAKVTKIRVNFKSEDKSGTLLHTKLFDIFPEVNAGEVGDIFLDFGEDLILQGNVYIEIRMNSYAVLYASSSYAYPYPDKKIAAYTTDGNITTSAMILASPKDDFGRVYLQLYSSVEFNHILTDDQITNIESRLDIPVDTLSVNLPDKIYAVVGDTLQLFFRGMIQAVNPYDYDILITCSKGNKYPRYFEYTPGVSDVGTTTFKITIKNSNGKTLGEKTCNLITKAAPSSPSSLKNVACFGDSLTSAGTWCEEACRRLIGTGGTPSGNQLSNIAFVGSKHNNLANYFGVGGWQWRDYTTAGRPAFRFQVSGVTSLSVGAVYSNNGHNYTIQEVNVTSGSGNILCSVSNASDTPQTSGTLTKVSGNGDATITFASYSQDSQNPLWDYQNNKMTFIPYVTNYCGGQLDVVYTLLSWNGQTARRTDFTSVINQIKIFADTLHKEYPNAKLKIMGIQVPSVNGGMGANYGAGGSSYSDGYGMVITALNMNKAYQDFANSSETSGTSGDAYSTFVEFVNVSAEFDSDNNMPYKMKKVNTRNTLTEMIGTNGVHPSADGYNQIGDIVYRNFVANYCQ